MTITIEKLHLAVAVFAIVLIAPATAVATHIFDDVSDGAFYADPVEWALENEITTGSPAGSSNFKPLDPVTRGESVTFLSRYDTNIVQPALADLMPGAGVSFADGNQSLELTSTTQSVRSVELVAPAAGHVIVTASAQARFDTAGVDVASCSITAGAIALDASHLIVVDDLGIPASLLGLPFSGTRTFAVPSGSTTFRLACLETGGGVTFYDSQITALYAPNVYAP